MENLIKTYTLKELLFLALSSHSFGEKKDIKNDRNEEKREKEREKKNKTRERKTLKNTERKIEREREREIEREKESVCSEGRRVRRGDWPAISFLLPGVTFPGPNNRGER